MNSPWAFNINPLTGDGLQFLRVAGAVAAENPWLITGNDTARFKFEVITSGTEAMNLQAAGAEGRVLLSWTQDYFALLAGYNLYRAESYDGFYTRLNTTVIPPDQKTFEDTAVVPGRTYYYRFTVLRTDFTESDYSNIASARPLDTMPPVISHAPIVSANVGLPLHIFAYVTDNVGVSSAVLHFRPIGAAEFVSRNLVRTTGNRFSATLEGAIVQAPGLEYYLEVSDGVSIATSGTKHRPHSIVVSDNPTITAVTPAVGNSDGGTTVTIVGTNFKAGAKVRFGEAPAIAVVDSAHRITATTPAHFPAVVDVTVVNPDGAAHTLHRAYTFRAEGVEVRLPHVRGNVGHSIDGPIEVLGVSGLAAATVTVQFDARMLEVSSVRRGSLTAGFLIASNSNTPGQVTITLAGDTLVTGSGTLAVVNFTVLRSDLLVSTLAFENVRLNDGSITLITTPGSFAMAPVHNISGAVNYFSHGQAVPRVSIALQGTETGSTTTDAAGRFTFSAPSGNYELTPAKSDDTLGITAFDASLILRAAANVLSLSASARLAADVDSSDNLDPMDAFYVLRHAAGLQTLPFPGSSHVWLFSPASRNIANLAADLLHQDFTATLLGDVSGNWAASAAQATGSATLSLGQAKVTAGESATMPITLGGGPIFAADITLTYDHTAFTITGVETTSATTNAVLIANLAPAGVVRIALASLTPIEPGTILNLTLQAHQRTGSHSMAVTAVLLDEVAHSEVVPGTVEIAELLYGDVDQNGRVEVSDAVLILRHIVGIQRLSAWQQKLANVDGTLATDGQPAVDVGDAVLVLRFIVNLITRFPVQP